MLSSTSAKKTTNIYQNTGGHISEDSSLYGHRYYNRAVIIDGTPSFRALHSQSYKAASPTGTTDPVMPSKLSVTCACRRVHDSWGQSSSVVEHSQDKPTKYTCTSTEPTLNTGITITAYKKWLQGAEPFGEAASCSANKQFRTTFVRNAINFLSNYIPSAFILATAPATEVLETRATEMHSA
jgi:hypothetical protein